VAAAVMKAEAKTSIADKYMNGQVANSGSAECRRLKGVFVMKLACRAFVFYTTRRGPRRTAIERQLGVVTEDRHCTIVLCGLINTRSLAVLSGIVCGPGVARSLS